MKTIQCEYCGVMGGGIVLWNLLEDASPEHIAGSTISTSTMCKLELVPPQAEVDKAAKAILADPNSPPALVYLICDLQVLANSMTAEVGKTSRKVKDLMVPAMPDSAHPATNLQCQIWVRHWFRTIKGRDPEDDFVAWCVDNLERGACILLKHEPKPE